jgi:hypothetical protein
MTAVVLPQESAMTILYSFLVTAMGTAMLADIADNIVSMIRKPNRY